jgi:uncharacterized protein (TIGR02246 family)
MRRFCLIVSALSFVLTVTACAPADEGTGTPGDTMTAGDSVDRAGDMGELADADRAAIEAASDRWVAAAQAGQWDSVANLYSDDAVIMPPNMASGQGRASVREHLGAFPPLESMSFDHDDIDGCGDLAYVQGRYTFRFNVDGQSVEDRGKYIEIWERGDDGQWRITRDIFNSDMPAQAQAGA